MNVNTERKLIYKIFILVLFAAASIASAASFEKCRFCSAGELLDRISAPPTCAGVKKRIMAALELYRVDNRLKSDARVSVRDIVSARYLKYELVCPDGGKYSFTPEMKLKCSKCDAAPAGAPNPAPKGTNEVDASKKPGADATLESKINKYLDIEDIEFLNNPRKSEAPADSSPVAVTDTPEVETAAKAGEKNAFKTVPGAEETGETTAGEEGDEGEDASVGEQISVKESPAMGKGARDYHNEAIEHARRGETDNAIEKFKKAIELVPDSFTYHYNYGLFLAKIESYDQAYIEFQRAMRLDPQNSRVKTMIEKLKKAISTR